MRLSKTRVEMQQQKQQNQNPQKHEDKSSILNLNQNKQLQTSVKKDFIKDNKQKISPIKRPQLSQSEFQKLNDKPYIGQNQEQKSNVEKTKDNVQLKVIKILNDVQSQNEETRKGQERFERVKLREEERLRRAFGLASAYEDHKEPLPIQLQKQLKENINSTNENKTQEDYYNRKSVREEFSTQSNFHNDHRVHSPNQQKQYDDHLPSANNQKLFEDQKLYQIPKSQEALEKTQKNQEDKLKQKQYKEDLDFQINQKRNHEQNIKPYSAMPNKNQNLSQPQEDFFSKFEAHNKPTRQQQNNPHLPKSQPPFNSLSEQDKKIKFADELMDQLVSKQRVVAHTQQQIHSEQQSYLTQEQQRTQIQKIKYKEELDRQIEENKQIREQSRGNFFNQQEHKNQSTSQSSGFHQMKDVKLQEMSKQNQTYTHQQQQNISPINIPSQSQYQQNEQQLQPTPNYINHEEQFNNEFEQSPQIQVQEQEQRSTFARKMHFSNNMDPNQVDIQKQQKQKYAEELKQQVEERTRIKQKEEKKYQEQDRIELLRIQKAEEDKKSQEQKIKSKQVEVYSHQVVSKKGRKQIQQTSQIDQTDQNIQGPIIIQNQIKSDETQALIQDLEQNQHRQPQIELQKRFVPDSKQYATQIDENLLGLQQLAVVSKQDNFFDHINQVNKYQKVLFNPNVVPQPFQMQIHQNYLVQLQQSKQEIEIVRQILEEKLRIQQLEIQNQVLVEQYKTKVKDISSEQILFEREIQKLQHLITTNQIQEPLNPYVFTSALQMSQLGQEINPQQPAKMNKNSQSLLPQNKQNQIQMNNQQKNNNNQVQLNNPMQYPIIPIQNLNINQKQPFELPRDKNQIDQSCLPFDTHLVSDNQENYNLQQDLNFLQDIELPASSDQIAILNNSIWMDVKQQNNKSYMVELQYVQRSFVNPINEIEQFQIQTSQSNDEQVVCFSEEDESEQLQGSHLNVDGFDVNMLRTQDYMNMFKENIQKRAPDIPVQKTIQSQERNIIGNQLQQSSSTNAMSQFQSKIQYMQGSLLSSVEENSEQKQSFSQLAVSGTIPLSELQKCQEQIMSDAKYSYGTNSLLLPDEDEAKIINFIESNEDYEDQGGQLVNQKFTGIELVTNWSSFPDQQKYQKQSITLYMVNREQYDSKQEDYRNPGVQVNNSQSLQPKPFMAQNIPFAPNTPVSNYMTVRSEQESISSKKYKKPKTLDIFPKLDSNSTTEQQFRLFMSKKPNQSQAHQ